MKEYVVLYGISGRSMSLDGIEVKANSVDEAKKKALSKLPNNLNIKSVKIKGTLRNAMDLGDSEDLWQNIKPGEDELFITDEAQLSNERSGFVNPKGEQKTAFENWEKKKFSDEKKVGDNQDVNEMKKETKAGVDLNIKNFWEEFSRELHRAILSNEGEKFYRETESYSNRSIRNRMLDEEMKLSNIYLQNTLKVANKLNNKQTKLAKIYRKKASQLKNTGGKYFQ